MAEKARGKHSTVPGVRIDASGAVTAMEPGARAILGAFPGVYKTLRAGSLLVLTLDEGTGAAPRDGEELVLAGSLAKDTLLGLLNLFAQNRDTGRLVLKKDHIERVIMLKQGDVASVGSNALDDRLGRFLVRLGKVTDQQLEAAENEARVANKRIGQVLVSQGLLDAHELWSTIQAQITDIFSDVVQWQDGSFILYRLPEGYSFPSTPPLSMQGLMLESLRRADELSVFRERIPDRQVRLEPTGKAPNGDLEDVELRAFEAIGLGASVADVARLLHLTEFDATRACFGLLRSKLVQIAETPQAAKALELTPDQKARLEVYNLAFREIRDEMERHGKAGDFIASVEKYLQEPSIAHAMLFSGVLPDATGALPGDQLVLNLARLDTAEPMDFLQEALNELTFFMLFQCGEMLDAQSDENLGRRVRLIHAALSAPPTAAKPTTAG